MAEERLQPISLHQEMQRSYLEYAMSVIVGRALPDARDGLKPVQRRILFAMHELGLSPDRPFRKCARVVGDVLGKYHPHGDQAVYDALVRLVQDFSSRYPVLKGHGNFGSIDDDPPAAMRYTETRLASIAHEAILEEIGLETVDFAPNFDGSQQEPTVLPAQLPFLLLNGCSGIAVGMATSIPPHNLNEVVDGLIALIKNENLSDEKLLKLIPGPDFPTGGEILIGSGIRETYIKGRGSIPMRGITHIEEIQPGKGKHKRNAVVITELPYQVSKAGWIEKLADIVNDGKITGISDIRDESDREGMRIVVELRRDANQEQIMKDLHRKTALQSNFGSILLALVNGQPKQLSLRNLLKNFLEYRELTVIKRTNYSLKKTREREEVVAGLLKALAQIKIVIDMIQSASDAGQAKARLMVRLEITEKQADAVLAMPLRRLTSLEQESLSKEGIELEEKKKQLEALLENRNILLELMINELKKLKKKFGNSRRTKLTEGGDELLAEKNANQRPNAELQRKQALEAMPPDGKLIIQKNLEVKIISPQLLGRLHLNEPCELGEESNPTKLIWPIEEKPKLLAITERGKIAQIKWEFAGMQPGKLEKFLPTGLEKEKIIDIIPMLETEEVGVGLFSSDGRFKRLSSNEIMDISGRAATIVKLKDGVNLKSAILCYPEQNVVLATDIGRVLKMELSEKTLPTMGKLAQGPIAVKLFPGENIVGAISNSENSNKTILMATNTGKISKLNINDIRSCERGELGIIGITLKDLKNRPERVISINHGYDVLTTLTSLGRSSRLDAEKIQTNNPAEPQQNIINLKENEYLESLNSLIMPEK